MEAADEKMKNQILIWKAAGHGRVEEKGARAAKRLKRKLPGFASRGVWFIVTVLCKTACLSEGSLY